MEQFQIGPKLGRGVVGTSYSGQLADHTPVVVKVISRRFHEHAELLEQVLEDLRGWEGFRHLNVACTRSVGRHQDRHVVLFERAPGTTLAQWLGDHGPMDARKAVLVLRDLALVMAAVHQGEMPLGDIRSSKVYFNGHRARITDLGLARASCLAAGYGKHGMTFGHPAYLAPEVLQLRLAAPTPQTDVYAAGCLFYELLTGKPPFEGPAEQALRAHFEGELPPPPPAIVGSPKGRKLLVHMLAKDPGKRFHDGQALVDALYELVGQAPPQQELAAMNSGIWRAQAARPDLRGRADWSPERVFNAQPIGPDLSGEGAVSGRFPRQSVQPPAAAPAAAASGGEGGEGGGEGDDDVPLDGVRVDKKLGRGPVGTTYEGKLAHYTGDVVVKVPVGPREHRFTTALATTPAPTPRLAHHGTELGGYDLAWFALERLPGEPISNDLSKKTFKDLAKAAAAFYRWAEQTFGKPAGHLDEPDWETLFERARQAVKDHGVPDGQRWNDAIKRAQKAASRLLDRWRSRPVETWRHGDLHPANAMRRPKNSPWGEPGCVLIDLANVQPGHWIEDAVYLERVHWGKDESLDGVKPVKLIAEARKKAGLDNGSDYNELAEIRRVLLAATAPAYLKTEGHPKRLAAALRTLEQRSRLIGK